MASWAKAKVLHNSEKKGPTTPLENAHVWRPEIPDDPIVGLLEIEGTELVVKFYDIFRGAT